jgi:hypothetical protein
MIFPRSHLATLFGSSFRSSVRLTARAARDESLTEVHGCTLRVTCSCQDFIALLELSTPLQPCRNNPNRPLISGMSV